MQTNVKTAILSLFLLLTGLSSCKKDDNTVNGGGDDSFVSFKVDGTAYRIEGVLAYGTELSDQYGIYAVHNPDNSTKTDDRLLYILIDQNHGVGRHLLVKDSDTDWGVWIVGDGATDDKEFFTYNDTGGGFVEITKKTDELIEGNFSFTVSTFNGTNKAYITEGKFSVKVR